MMNCDENEQALTSAKFQTLFASASSAMALLHGEEFVYEMANPEYLRLVNNRAILNKPLIVALPEIKNTPLPKIMKDVWITGEAYVGKELLVQLAKVEGGPLFDWYFDFTYSRVDVKGKPYGIYIHAVDVTDKVNSRLRIEDSQRKLNIALDSAKMGTWDLDLVTNKVTWSPRTNELFGVDPIDNFPLETAINQIHPDDQERVKKAIADAVNPEGNGRYAIEYRTRRPDGTYRLLNVIGRAYFSDHSPTHFTGIVYDISDERKLQKEIENRELEFRSLANSIPALCWMADKDGSLYWYNQRWFDYTGSNLEEMKHWGWQKVMAPELLQDVSDKWLHSLKNENPFDMTFKLRSRNGDFRWFLTRAVPIRDSSGKVIKWFGSNTDIHDQMMTESALEAKSRELEAIITNMVEGLVLADHEGNILLWNPAALKMHKFKSGDDIINKLRECPDLFELSTLEGKVLPLEDWPLSRILQGEQIQNFDVYVLRKDTNYKFAASYSGRPVRDESGNIRLAVINISDVSDRYKTQDELQNALKVRDEFLSIASHELKTRLTALIMQSQMQMKLINKNDPKAFEESRLRKLFIQNERLFFKLNRLIEDMLDISRIRTGRLHIYKSRVNISELISEVLERLSSEFAAAGCGEPQFKFVAVWGEWDPLRIEQVITNLLTNAIRYGKGQPIRIEVEEDDKEVRVLITDLGIGIAEEDQEKIFNRFERAINSGEVSGLGLGLFIAKQIIHEHGGTISLSSKLGEGSTFTVHLPR